MANQLKMATVQSILTLHERGGSGRRIADELDVDRGNGLAIRRVGKTGKPARCGGNFKTRQRADDPGRRIGAFRIRRPPCGRCPADRALPGPQSNCQPWREIIEAKQAQGLSARRIHQDLVGEHAAAVSYDSVRRFLRRLGWVRPLPFRRIERAAGEEAQVDFGTGAPIIGPDGKRRKTHVFRIVLSHSRKAYSEATYRQTTEDFLRALENAFEHFGGVPQSLVIDNLKAAVKHPDWFDPEAVTGRLITGQGWALQNRPGKG